MSHLPADVLCQVAVRLPLKDMVHFHLVCRHWKEALETADFYKKVAEHHWTPVLCNAKLSPFQGSWRRLCLSKAATDRSFSKLMEQGASSLMGIHNYAKKVMTTNLGGLCSVNPRSSEIEPLFTGFMEATFQLGLKVQLRPSWGKSRSFLAYLEATAALVKDPLVVLCLNDFVAVSEQLCMVYDVWNGGFVEWSSVPWRRSALEFFTDFYIRSMYHPQPFRRQDEPTLHLDPTLNPSKRSKRQAPPKLFKQGILTSLDVTISSTAGDEIMGLSVVPVPGLPSSHWWWFPDLAMRRSCD